MKNLTIITHKEGRQYPPHTLFALSRGRNLGKPLDKPCPNCFAISMRTEIEKNCIKYVLMALQQTRQFYPYHRGSVITFITIKDFSKILTNHWNIFQASPQKAKKMPDKFNHLNLLEQNAIKTLKLHRLLVEVTLYEFMKQEPVPEMTPLEEFSER